MAKENNDKAESQTPESDQEAIDIFMATAKEVSVDPVELVAQLLAIDKKKDSMTTAGDLIIDEALGTINYYEKLRIAREAIEVEEDNLMAMYILGGDLENENESLEWLIKAEAKAAEELEDDFFDEYMGNFSMYLEGIQYLGIAYRLANKLTKIGKLSEAIEILEELLELDEKDAIRARDLLLPVYAVTRKFNAYERLRKQFGDEATTASIYNHVLYTAMKYGVGLKANYAMKKAIEYNDNIFKLLVQSISELAFEEDSQSLEEGGDYIIGIIHLWYIHPKIGVWFDTIVMDTSGV